MAKYTLLSAALSILMIALLPLHNHFTALLGNQDWLNMAFGLPIGLALAVNIDLVRNKIRRK